MSLRGSIYSCNHHPLSENIDGPEPNIHLTSDQSIISSVSAVLQLKKNAAKRTRQHAMIHPRSSSTEGHLSLKVIFH